MVLYRFFSTLLASRCRQTCGFSPVYANPVENGQGGQLSPILSGLLNNAKPLPDEKITQLYRKFGDVEFEFENIFLAEDDDLKDLCPNT